MVQIELLYFDDCPSWKYAWNQLGVAIAEANLDTNVRLRNIAGMTEKQLEGFGGSPTVRINGRDLEGYEGPPLLACRRYANNEGRGWPSLAAMQKALQNLDRAGTGA